MANPLTVSCVQFTARGDDKEGTVSKSVAAAADRR